MWISFGGEKNASGAREVKMPRPAPKLKILVPETKLRAATVCEKPQILEAKKPRLMKYKGIKAAAS